MCPRPVQRIRNSPAPLKNPLAPPHLVSTSTLVSDAIHEPDCTIRACEPSTSIWVMSPGRAGATDTEPPLLDRNVLMKKLSPPRTLRRRPFMNPPPDLVSTSTPSLYAAIAPASVLTSPPGGRVMVANANAGLAAISTCMAADRRPAV